MNILETLWDAWFFSPIAWATGGSINPMDTGSPPPPANDDPTDTTTRRKASMVLLGSAAFIGAVAAAPTLYKLYATKGRKGSRKRKQAEDISNSLEGASHRATTILAALAPSIGLPAAYILVQELENANVITKGLGDNVQTMLGIGAVAPAIGAVAQFIPRGK